MGNGMTEYVIKLTTQLDNAGVTQIIKSLDMTKLRALGLTAALTTLSTAIYKFASATAKHELELQKLAKTQHKSTVTINAQNTALKSMGKTLKEINKDKELKKVYEDIKKFNLEMKLPKIDETLKKIKDLRNAFWKLKDALNFATQSIGRQFLINMQRPIEKLTGGLNDISKWVQNNLNSISAKVSSVLTAFSKGVFGLGEGVVLIFDKVNQLPDSIKQVGLALAGIFAFVKIGPLGRILALVTLIGDIIHDKDVYDWNKEHGYKPGDENYVGNLNDLYGDGEHGIWDLLFGDEADVKGFTQTIIKNFFDTIIEALGNFSGTLDEATIGSWFDDETSFIGQVFAGIKNFLLSAEGQDKVSGLFHSLLETVLSIEGFTGRLGSDIIQKFGKMVGTAFESEDFVEGVKQAFGADENGSYNTVSTGVVNAVVTGLLTGGNFFAALVSGISTIYKQAKLEAQEQGIKETDDNYWSTIFDIASEDFTGMVDGLALMLSGALQTAVSVIDNVGDIVFNGIAKKLGEVKDPTGMTDQLKTAFELLGSENGILGKAISVGLSAGIATDSTTIGILSGITTAVTEAINNPEAFAAEMKSFGEAFGKFFDILWNGQEETTFTKVMGFSRFEGLNKMLFGDQGIGGWFKTALSNLEKDIFGDQGFVGWLEKLFDVQEGSGFEGIGEKIKTLLEPIGDSIKDFFSSLWVDIYNGLPGVLQGMFVDPNKSEVVSNGDGTYTVTSSNNNTAQITPKTKELGQWLIDNKDYITVDSGGQLRFTKGLGQMYTYDEKTGTFSQYDANWLLNDLQKGRTTSDRWFAPEVDILTELNKVIEQYGQPKVEPTLDVSSLVQQASSLTLTGAKVIADLVVKGTNDAGSGTAGIAGGGNGGGGGYVAMNPMADKGGSFAPKAWGGRIGRRMDGVTVGEDGTEYIIPITKPERAASLIQQMFGELGPSVMERITSGMGLGQPGTNGFSLSSLQGAIGGMTANSNTTINAPMNFYINSSGADAKEIGSSIYDSAERHLIRNVMGVYA